MAWPWWLAVVALVIASLVASSPGRTQHLTRLPRAAEMLPGRTTPLATRDRHVVFGTPLAGPFTGMEQAVFGMGCFWGAEEHFFHVPGVVSTAAGYAGGATPNPTYEEVSSGLTGHAEVVRVVFDPQVVSYEQLLRIFWEGHDPTQGMRQGPDMGTQYRSVILTASADQQRRALASRDAYAAALRERGLGPITTDIRPAGAFYLAESEHQQYCALNPQGYCGHGGTGVALPASR